LHEDLAAGVGIVVVAVVADLAAMKIALLPRRTRLPLHATFDQPLDVNRARREMIKAVPKRVLKLIQMKMLRATLIGAIQKRAIVVVFGHPQRGILPASSELSATVPAERECADRAHSTPETE
jgi:hypothetical protein